MLNDMDPDDSAVQIREEEEEKNKITTEPVAEEEATRTCKKEKGMKRTCMKTNRLKPYIDGEDGRLLGHKEGKPSLTSEADIEDNDDDDNSNQVIAEADMVSIIKASLPLHVIAEVDMVSIITASLPLRKTSTN